MVRFDTPAARRAYVLEIGRCQNPFCETPGSPLHVHEIARGIHRAECKKHRCGCLVLCDVCNCGPFTDASEWPEARQLALKLLVDPANFSLGGYNELRRTNSRPAPNRIEPIEVLAALAGLQYQILGLTY